MDLLNLELLCCPETKSSLVFVKDALISVNPESRRKYFVKNGIPVFLIEESVKLSKQEWDEVMRISGINTKFEQR